MFRLIIDGKSFLSDEVLHGEVHAVSADGHVLEALAFIKKWLEGQETFSVNTSGSTGKPKPIEITRRQMQASAAMTINALGLQPGHIALLCLDPTYIAGKMMIVRALEGNMPLVITKPDANPLKNIPNNQAIDFTALVPYQLKAILAQDRGHHQKINQMKGILLGGGPVDGALENEIQSIDAPVYTTFAMTETVSHFALRRINGLGKSPFFQVMDNMKVSLDERGCLCVEGPVTNHKTVVTNDLVEMIDEKHFRWLGRADNVINSGGVKICPETQEPLIASVLKELGIQRNFFLWGFPSKDFGQEAVLVIEGQPFDHPEKVLSSLKEKLPKYQAPKAIYFVEQFSFTETHKIQRQLTVNQLSLRPDNAFPSNLST